MQPRCAEEAEAMRAEYCGDLFKLKAFEKAFKPGDALRLKMVRGVVQATVDPHTHSEELDCINRLLDIATKIEEQTFPFQDGVFYKKEEE